MAWSVFYDGTDITEYVRLTGVRGHIGGRAVRSGFEVELLTRGDAVFFENEKSIVIKNNDGDAVQAGTTTKVSGGSVTGLPQPYAERWVLTASDVVRDLQTTYLPEAHEGVITRTTEETAVERAQWFIEEYCSDFLSTDWSGMLSDGIDFVSPDFDQNFNGSTLYDRLNAIFLFGGLYWRVDAEGKVHCWDANYPPFLPIEIYDGSSVTLNLFDEDATALPVRELTLDEDTENLATAVTVVYNNGADSVTVTGNPEDLPWRTARLVALDVITSLKAQSLGRHHLRTRNRRIVTGSAVVPYHPDFAPGWRIRCHQIHHDGIWSGYRMLPATIQTVELLFEEDDLDGPTWCRLSFGEDPYNPPSLPKPVAAGGDATTDTPSADYDSGISKWLAGFGGGGSGGGGGLGILATTTSAISTGGGYILLKVTS